MTSRQRQVWAKRLGVVNKQVADTKDRLRFDTETALDAQQWLVFIGVDPHARQHWAALEKAMQP